MKEILSKLSIREPPIVEIASNDLTLIPVIRQLASDAQSGVNAGSQRVLEAVAMDQLRRCISNEMDNVFQKGVLHGLLIAYNLPEYCMEIVKQLPGQVPEGA